MRGKNEVRIGKTRFTALSPALVRLEYDEERGFEDRPSLRALTRPKPIKFEKVVRDGKRTNLSIGKIKISYRNDGLPFSAANLSIKFECRGREREWNPKTRDNANLGGTFSSLDLVDRRLIPRNVHPADIRDIDENTLTGVWPAKEKYFAYAKLPFDYRDRRWMLDVDERWKEIPRAITRLVEKRRKYPAGILSRNGFFLLNDSRTPLFDTEQAWWKERPGRNLQDWYFFAHGNDYRRALKDFVLLCGKIPMLPKWAFGIWFSVYRKIGAQGNRGIVNRFRKEKLPLAVLIVDLYWHRHGWCGFDWNKRLYPEPEKFLGWLHKLGLRAALNVHPGGLPPEDSHFSVLCQKLKIKKLPGPDSRANYYICDLSEKKNAETIMNDLHLPVQKQGADFWWIDGSSARGENLPGQLWTNHVYYTYLEKKSRRRALILSRYGGIGSHRYPVSFSGDAFSEWEVLRSEIDFTARAGNVAAAYWSHDIGGFMNKDTFWEPGIDPELFVRWVQFGCFSPVVRLHSYWGVREPWKYGRRVLEAVRAAFQLRMSLIPYIYHYSHITHKTGIPLCRPMYLHYPDDENSYQHNCQYFFGESIMVAPVAIPGGEKTVYLPRAKWYAWEGTETFSGPEKIARVYSYQQIPVLVKAGSIIPRQRFSNSIKLTAPATLILDIYPGENTELAFYEDDGESLAYRKGKFSLTGFKLREEEKKLSLEIGKTTGSYPGMPGKRNYEINIYSAACPRKILLNGNALPSGRKLSPGKTGWAYDKSARRIKLHTGTKPVSSSCRAEIIF